MGHKSDLEKSWCCDQCKNITRRKRTRNDETPTRQQFDTQVNENLTTVNINYDDPKNPETYTNDSKSTETPTTQTRANNVETDTITLQQFARLIEIKFDDFRNTIRQDIAMEFETRMGKINSDFSKKIEHIEIEQQALKSKITDLTKTIKSMENNIANIKNNNNKTKECPPELNLQLKDEITLLRDKIYKEANGKKIVLYGLDEYWDESENQIIERINYAFYDLLNIDINGYIESVSRIGKRGYRRPIVIELISRRMTEYIIQNSNNFRNSGLYVSTVLSKAELEEKRALKTKLQEARRNGYYATIRQNKLYINGKLQLNYSASTQDQSTTSPKSQRELINERENNRLERTSPTANETNSETNKTTNQQEDSNNDTFFRK